MPLLPYPPPLPKYIYIYILHFFLLSQPLLFLFLVLFFCFGFLMVAGFSSLVVFLLGVIIRVASGALYPGGGGDVDISGVAAVAMLICSCC